MAKGEGLLAILAGDGDDKKDAAKDVLDAIAGKDVDALSMALERFYAACDSADKEEDE